MTPELLAWIKSLIAAGDTTPFYCTRIWRKKRKAILDIDRFECQRCKDMGLYEEADTVHHVKPLEDFPELALESFYYEEDGTKRRQPISLSHNCHDIIEKHGKKLAKPLTPERW